MKHRIAIPTLVSGVIAIAAASLFLHTAVTRHEMAEARRAEKARLFSRDGHSSVATSRRTSGPVARAEVIETKVRHLLAIGRLLDQRRAMLAMTKDFSSEDFRLALEAGKNLSGSDQSLGFESLLKEWSLRDPLAAMAYAGEDIELKADVFRVWAEYDQETAVQWVWQQLAENAGAKLPGFALDLAARQDLETALTHLEDLSPGERHAALDGMISSAGKERAAKLVAWVEALEDPAERSAAAIVLFSNWNPRAGREEQFALLEKNPEVAEDGRLQYQIRGYAEENPEAARAALEYVPAGPARRDALAGILPTMIMKGTADAFAEVIASYPDDVDEDLLVKSISIASYDSPQKALEQVSLINSPETRDEKSAEWIDRWMDNDSVAATEWLSHNEPTPKAREMIQNLATERAAAKLLGDK